MNPQSTDIRESLANDGRSGPAAEISLPRERITRLRGILFDLDPKYYAPGNPLFPPADDMDQFWEQVRGVLDRHPLACDAEVRGSGTGLHAILWLDPAVDMTSEMEQHRWRMLVQAVQCSLPIDPTMPDITALTRPVGAINSKNGAVVRQLRAGRPVTPARVQEFVRQLDAAPFKQIAVPLLGSERMSPCPVCRKVGSQLSALDRVGICYGNCGKVKVAELWDAIYGTPT